MLPGALLLQWIDPAGGLHDYQPDAGDHYALGQHVRIVDSPTVDCGWDTPSGVDGGVATMIVVLGVVPLGGLALLAIHRVRLWRRLRKSSESHAAVHFSVSLYKAPWRTFIAVHTLGRDYYVPLMRGQRVESLEPIALLQPMMTPEPRAQVLFRVRGTDRVVWPGGGCHPSIWPVGRMTFTVARVFGPLLLIPVMHWVTSTLPC